MSYPPSGAKRPRELGATPPAKVVFIDRRAGATEAFRNRANRALHVDAPSGRVLCASLAAAAHAASADRTVSAQQHLWQHLDPAAASKSAAVKTAKQALYLRQLYAAKDVLAPLFQAWLRDARLVALGMHALFDAGMCEWNVGLDPATNEVLLDAETGRPTHKRDAWFPFERYDRTAVDPRYANCFGDSEAQRMRSRVAFDKCRNGGVSDAHTACWHHAEQAHRRMLDVEAKGRLFDDPDRQTGLTAAELGGLFMLTNTPDNWAKRPELFDPDFWLLRAVHFGLERNLGLRINRFSLDGGGAGGRLALRQSCPDPLRSYCWLDNALHTIVALKVVVFLRLRWHAYDRAEGLPRTSEAALAELVLADRHDVEQSKNHWLPPGRQSGGGGGGSSSSSGGGSPSASPSGPQPLPAPALDSESLVERLVQWLLARRRERGCGPLREVLGTMATERFRLLQRIEELDRLVGLHLAHRRAMVEATRRIESAAAEQMDALVAERGDCERRDGAARERQAIDDRIEELTRRCQLGALEEEARERVRLSAANEGLWLRASDRVWADGAAHPVVHRLVEVGAAPRRADECVRFRRRVEWLDHFGGGGSCRSAAVCDPAARGYARLEALALCQRLLGLLRSEAEFRASALDALVPLPLECRHDIALGHADAEPLAVPKSAPPQHAVRYAVGLRGEAERRQLMIGLERACCRSMGRALRRCFWTCIDAVSEGAGSDSDSEPEDADGRHPAAAAAALRMPDRIFAGQRAVACDILHRMLNIAEAHNGLATLRDEDPDNDPSAEPPILVYHPEARRLRMPDPEAVVACHWEAARHLLELAERAEPWVRDRRRRIDRADGVLLDVEERWVTLSATEGLVVHGEARRAAAAARLAEAEPELATRYWPSWPPREHELCTAARVRTALRWGRHAAVAALGSGERALAAGEAIPPEPYASLPRGVAAAAGRPHALGEHAWLHRAHEASSREQPEYDNRPDDDEASGGGGECSDSDV